MFVLDSVVHVQDYRHQMVVHPDGDLLRGMVAGFAQATAAKGPPADLSFVDGPPEHDWANEMLFDRSGTDVAMVQAVPLFGLFKEGVGPFELAEAYYRSNPERLLLCGAVDPLYQGIKGALDEMERQAELGAISFKFYQAQTTRTAWRADDRVIAYPLYEKAQELGIKMVQFHKGLPLGRQRVEDVAPNDIQLAAYDFPDLLFGLHHLGHPYVDETVDIASRFGNVYLILPLLFNQYFIQPREMLHRLGKALFYCGDDRLCYGSDGFVWPHFQAYLDLIAELEMPEDLQDGYGYPALTRTTRENILGLNFARALGIDVARYGGGPEDEPADPQAALR
jgi:predicted TIM-barrel fold metal-dependent hydrolase